MFKILIIDDEIKVCNLICALIDWSTLNMEIVGVAQNGYDALELVSKHFPDIIITDIRMPGIDGIEFIQAAKKISKNSDFIIISGYRQFEYAQSAVKFGVSDYLLKPIKKTDLENTLKSLIKKRGQIETEKIEESNKINKLRLASYTDILFGNNKISDIENINKNYEFEQGYFQCFVVKIDFPSIQVYKNTINIITEKTINIINSIISSECCDIEFMSNNGFIYCVINYSIEKKDYIRKKIKFIMDEFNLIKDLFNNIQFTIGLGSANKKLFKNSIEDVYKLVMQRILLKTGNLIEYLPVKQLNLSPVEANNFRKEIENYVEILDIDSLVDFFISLKDKVLKTEMMGYEIYNFIVNFYDIYLIKIKKYHLVSIQKAKEDIFEFSLCSNINEIFDLFKIKSKKIVDEIIETKKQENIKPIRIAKQYIIENYMNYITLEDISNIVGFNPSYFSVLFKKETGENFLTYITKIRIEKAKFFLKETNLNISDISEKVGYIDVRHFTKYFKKYAGIKPNEYRKLYS